MQQNSRQSQARDETISTRATASEKRDLEMLAIARNTSVAQLLRPRVDELVEQARRLREQLETVA